MELSAERVSEIFMDCLFKDGEAHDRFVKAEGIQTKVGFNPKRLEGYRADVENMLAELPDSFHEGAGGGMSFLNACEDRHGNQWTGMHQVMEELFLLGMGLGKVRCLMPREMWQVLPGGMPYYAVLTTAEPVAVTEV